MVNLGLHQENNRISKLLLNYKNYIIVIGYLMIQV